VKKYLVFRSLIDVVEDEELSSTSLSEAGEELITVELGASFRDVEQSVIDAINDDLADLAENEMSEVSCYQANCISDNSVAEFVGIVSLPYSSENTLRRYIVKERKEL